jgi:RNA polymerase sigma-70 factor (ECF subfamily)
MSTNIASPTSQLTPCHISRSRSWIAATETSDTDLLDAIAAGDRVAMYVLYARHNAKVYRFALRILDDEAAAEEVVNDVFFDVWHYAASFEVKSQVSTLLLAIARTKAISVVRGRSEAQLDENFASTTDDSAGDSEETTDKKGRSALLQRSLKHLSPAHREVIDLVYYHEKSIGEVAEILNTAENSVKTRMFDARKRLSELLAAKEIYTTRS